LKKGSHGSIEPTPSPVDKVSFSFGYLTTRPNNKFRYKERSSTYFCKVIDRLRHICGWTPLQLKTNNSKALRCHRIKWKDQNVTEDCFGIQNEEDLVGEEAYQFCVSGNKYGRIHGFFRDTIFHIVWLDPDHKLIKRPK